MKPWLFALLLTCVHSQAVLITFNNTTTTATDFSVDWSSSGMRELDDATAPDGWGYVVDSFAGPEISLIFNFVARPAIYFRIFEDGRCDVGTTETAAVIDQTASSVTLRLDREGIEKVAVPDTGSTFAMLGAALMPLVIRRRHMLHGLKNPSPN